MLDCEGRVDANILEMIPQHRNNSAQFILLGHSYPVTLTAKSNKDPIKKNCRLIFRKLLNNTLTNQIKRDI